jgi:hypothetical protein
VVVVAVGTSMAIATAAALIVSFMASFESTGEGGGTVMVMDLAVRRHSQIGSGYQMGSQLQCNGVPITKR